MTDDDWTTAAMSDGTLVAELLVHLRHTISPLPEKKKKKNRRSLSPPPPLLTWRVRQPRSRPVQTHTGCRPAASPTTPLSWSSATSASCGGGVEDAANKVIDPSENTTSKKSRKKKTLAEVKDDEALVLKEREDLKKKLASLRVAVEIERATNDRLKRLKLHYVSCSAKTVTLHVPVEQDLKMASYNPFSEDLRTNGSKILEHSSLKNCPKSHEEVTNRESKFKLPDLNLSLEDPTP